MFAFIISYVIFFSVLFYGIPVIVAFDLFIYLLFGCYCSFVHDKIWDYRFFLIIVMFLNIFGGFLLVRFVGRMSYLTLKCVY